MKSKDIIGVLLCGWFAVWMGIQSVYYFRKADEPFHEFRTSSKWLFELGQSHGFHYVGMFHLILSGLAVIIILKVTK